MVDIQIDRNKEYKSFLQEQIRRAGLSYIVYGGEISDMPVISTRKLFGKRVAYITQEPDLSPREYSAKPKTLEIVLENPAYDSVITNIAQAVENTFGIKAIVTKIAR